MIVKIPFSATDTVVHHPLGCEPGYYLITSAFQGTYANVDAGSSQGLSFSLGTIIGAGSFNAAASSSGTFGGIGLSPAPFLLTDGVPFIGIGTSSPDMTADGVVVVTLEKI